MEDRIPANPGRVLVTPENGGAAYYATLTRADNPTQEGTPLNKANLLTDATAALFGLDANAVPNDVLRWVGKYNQHWWSKSRASPAYYVLGEEADDIAASASNNYTYYYSDSVVVSEVGTVSLSEPISSVQLSVKTSSSSLSKWAVLTGKFYYVESSNDIFYMSNAPHTGSSSGYVYTTKQLVIGFPQTAVGETAYIWDNDQNAYPDSGTVDGFIYQYLGVPFKNAVTIPKIETGSYVGTGEYNATTPVPNELTFSIVPKIVFLYSEDYTSYNTIPTYYFFFNGQSSFIPYETSSGSNALTWSGKTVSWYYKYYGSVSQADGSKFQFNTAGKVYYYTAIG